MAETWVKVGCGLAVVAGLAGVVGLVGLGVSGQLAKQRLQAAQAEQLKVLAQEQAMLEEAQVALTANEARLKSQIAEAEDRLRKLKTGPTPVLPSAVPQKPMPSAVPALVEDVGVYEKMRHAARFGSHWIYEEDGFGTATVEDRGGVLHFSGVNTGSGKRATLEGTVTKVDAKGFTVNGRFSVTYKDDYGEDPDCGWAGNHRMNLSGHPHYFRMQGSCEGRHHYIDLFVDDSFLQ